MTWRQWLGMAVMAVGVTGCAYRNCSLYPLDTGKPVDGAALTGHWVAVDKKDTALPDQVHMTWNTEQKCLRIDASRKTDPKQPNQPGKLLPMMGKIYGLDGQQFLCLSLSEDIGKIIRNAGYDESSLALLQPVFHIMKMEIQPDQLTFYQLDFSTKDSTSSENVKFISPKLHYDKELSLIVNDTKSLAEILHDKGYRTEKYLTLKRLPEPAQPAAKK